MIGKTFKKLVLFCVLAISFLAFAIGCGFGGDDTARAYESPGTPTGYVNDFAEVLDTSAKTSLETSLSEFEKSTSNEISVVTVKNLSGDYIENYAEKLFKEWGIGTKDKDNGVLLLVVIEEREVRIEVGYGLEGALTDSESGRIVDGLIVPSFKSGDYAGGINAGVNAIMGEIKGEYSVMNDANVAKASSGSSGWNAQSILIVVFIFANFFFAFIQALGSSHRIWPGGVFGAVLACIFGVMFLSSWIMFFICVGGFAVGGLLLDLILSRAKFLDGWRAKIKKRRAGGGGWFIGGGHGGGWGGGSGGGGFGGFGGGSSGGGGASGRW